MKTSHILLISALITLPTSVALSQSQGSAPSANPPAVAPVATPAPAVAAPAVAAPAVVTPLAAPVATQQAPAPAPKSANKILKTAEGSFAAMRGNNGLYWSYMPVENSNWIILKETENTEKSIVLEGYGLKYTIDPAALRLILTDGNTRKAVNITEASSAIHADNVTEVTYGGGKFIFIEDRNGLQDVWEQTLTDGKKHQLMDQGGLVLYDPIRKILIALDIEKKLITFDVEAKKPTTQKIIDLRAAP